MIVRAVLLSGFALALSACGVADTAAISHPGVPSSTAGNPCSGFTCDGPGAQLNVAYPYRLFTHCGVVSTRFDGRTFYLSALDPSTVTGGLANPEDRGTMTLKSRHAAVFTSSKGNTIQFVDAPPAALRTPYALTVYVEGNQVVDRPFGGIVWRAQGTLPGSAGGLLANGQDQLTPVVGTMTLTTQASAVFHSSNGAQIPFVPAPLGCD